MRDLLKFEEQRKEDEKRKEEIKKEQKAAPIAQGGSVKDRRQALLERVSFIEMWGHGYVYVNDDNSLGGLLDSCQVGEKISSINIFSLVSLVM